MNALSVLPACGLSYIQADRSEPVVDRTIGEALRDAAGIWGERTALIQGSPGPDVRQRWSYLALLRGAEQAAHVLLERFSPGEHVAICAPNSPDWILVEFGAALAGLVLVPINPALQRQELAYLLRQSRASGILVRPEYRGRDLLSVVDEIRPGLACLREVISFSD